MIFISGNIVLPLDFLHFVNGVADLQFPVLGQVGILGLIKAPHAFGNPGVRGIRGVVTAGQGRNGLLFYEWQTDINSFRQKD